MDNVDDLVLGLEYYDGVPVPTGYVTDETKPAAAVALENFSNEIQKYGISKEVHAAVESIAPGTLKSIDVRKLTVHRSRTGQQVALEDISKALLIAGGVAAGGAGLFGLWKLVKYIMSKFGKDKDGGDEKDDTPELKKSAEEAKEAGEQRVAAAEKQVQDVVKEAQADDKPVDEAVVALVTRGIDDKDYVHKLGELAKKHYHTNPVYIPFINAMAHASISRKDSANVFSRTVDAIVKHPLTKRFPQYMFGLGTMTHPLPALAVCVLGGKIPDMPTITAADLGVLEDYADIFQKEFNAIVELKPGSDNFAAEVAQRASSFKRECDNLNERAPLVKQLMQAESAEVKNAMIGIHFDTTARGGFSKVILPPENGPIAEALASFFEAGGMPINSEKLSAGVVKISKGFGAAEKYVSGQFDDKVKEIEEAAMKGSARSAYTNWIGYLKKQFRTVASAIGMCRKQQAAIRYGVKWCRTASKSRLPSGKAGNESFGYGALCPMHDFVTSTQPLSSFDECMMELVAPGDETVGMEANWGKIALGGGAAAALFYMAYRVYCWITGNSGGGGGGGGGSSSSSSGLTGAVEKAQVHNANTVKKIEAVAERMESSAKETKELSDKAKSNVLREAVEAAVEKLPAAVQSEASRVIEHAPTPMQKAVIAKAATAANSKSSELSKEDMARNKRINYIVDAFNTIAGKFHFTDEQFVAAMASWDNWAHMNGFSKLSVINAGGDDREEIDSNYRNQLNAYLTKLTHSKLWTHNPVIAGAYCNGIYSFDPAIADRLPDPDEQALISATVNTVMSAAVPLIETVLDRAASEFLAIRKGTIQHASPEAIRVIDEGHAHLEKMLSDPNVVTCIKTAGEIREVMSKLTEYDMQPAVNMGNLETMPIDPRAMIASTEETARNLHELCEHMRKDSSTAASARLRDNLDEMLRESTSGQFKDEFLNTERLQKLHDVVGKMRMLGSITGQFTSFLVIFARHCEKNANLISYQLNMMDHARRMIDGAVNTFNQ